MRYKFYFNLKKKIEKELCLRKIRNLLRSLEESEACLSILWIASKATKASVEIESALFSGVTTCHHPFDEFIFCCARDFLRILHSIIEKLVKLYQHTVTCIKGNSYIQQHQLKLNLYLFQVSRLVIIHENLWDLKLFVLILVP